LRERLQTPFPILFVQYHLLGSTRRFAAIAAAYTGCVILGILVYKRSRPMTDWSVIAGYVLYVLPVVQTGILVLGSLGALHKALMRDHQTAMIESHRLTPMSNVAIALGYLLGPTLQISLLFGVNLVMGAVLFLVAAQPLWQWVAGNLILYNGMLTVWSMMVFMGVGKTKPTASVGIFVAVGMFSNLFILLLPGAGLMLGVLPVMCGLLLMLGTATITGLGVILWVPVAVNLTLTVYWLLAAASRYRRPDLPALNAARGGILLLLWLVFTGVGMVFYQRVVKSGVAVPEAPADVQWISALISSLLVAIVPLAGSAICSQRIRQGAAARGWTDRVPDWLVAVVCAPLLCGVLGVIASEVWRPLIATGAAAGGSDADIALFVWGMTLAAAALFLLTVLGLLRAVCWSNRGMRVIALIIAIVGLAGPPVVDGVLTALQHEFGYAPDPSWVFGCSPAGTIIAVWSSMNTPLAPGLGVQAAAAIGALAVAHWIRQRREALLPPAAAAPA